MNVLFSVLILLTSGTASSSLTAVFKVQGVCVCVCVYRIVCNCACMCFCFMLPTCLKCYLLTQHVSVNESLSNCVTKPWVRHPHISLILHTVL